MTENFLTIEEVAETLKVTRQTVSKYIQKRDLNAVKINKSYRIPSVDLESFLNRNSTLSEVSAVYWTKSRNCMLDYEGKSDEEEILGQKVRGVLHEVERNHSASHNRYVLGDNFISMKLLLPEFAGKVDLIYIDPPFGTGQDFVHLENGLAYSDNLLNHAFLEFLRVRLILLREFLSESGSIYLHIDKKIGHYVKILMDEVFGYRNFINDITRIKCNPKNFARNAYGNHSDMILFYARNRDNNIFNNIRESYSDDDLVSSFPKVHPTLGRYTTNPLHAPGETIDGDTGKEWKGMKPPKGRHWRYSRAELTRLDEEGLIEWSDSGNPRKMVFANEHAGKKTQDVWEFKDKGLSYVDYPTQKNQDMLERIILNSSNKDSLVLDCFAGSGGTLLVANQLGRRWLGIDNSVKSMETVMKRFSEARIPCNYYKVADLD